MTLKQAIAQRAMQAKYTQLMSSGKFTNTGKVYNPQQAVSDANDSDLRSTAQLDGNNKLNWK